MKLSNLCHKKRSGVWWIDAPKWNTWDSLSLPIFNKIILSQINPKVNDTSGNANNATVNSGTWTTGKYGKGVNVTGSNGSDVSVPDFSY